MRKHLEQHENDGNVDNDQECDHGRVSLSPELCAVPLRRCSDVGFSCATRLLSPCNRGFGAKGRCERPYERHRPQQPTGRDPDPAHGIDRAGLRMIPFVRELTWKFAQIDDDDRRQQRSEQRTRQTRTHPTRRMKNPLPALHVKAARSYSAQVLAAQSILSKIRVNSFAWQTNSPPESGHSATNATCRRRLPPSPCCADRRSVLLNPLLFQVRDA